MPKGSKRSKGALSKVGRMLAPDGPTKAQKSAAGKTLGGSPGRRVRLFQRGET